MHRKAWPAHLRNAPNAGRQGQCLRSADPTRSQAPPKKRRTRSFGASAARYYSCSAGPSSTLSGRRTCWPRFGGRSPQTVPILRQLPRRRNSCSRLAMRREPLPPKPPGRATTAVDFPAGAAPEENEQQKLRFPLTLCALCATMISLRRVTGQQTGMCSAAEGATVVDCSITKSVPCLVGLGLAVVFGGAVGARADVHLMRQELPATFHEPAVDHGDTPQPAHGGVRAAESKNSHRQYAQEPQGTAGNRSTETEESKNRRIRKRRTAIGTVATHAHQGR